MRALFVVFCVVAASSAADAKTKTANKKHHHVAAKKHARHAKSHAHERVAVRDPVQGQSVGAPWDGSLRDAAKLPEGDGYHIRRPWRAFGTRSTVDEVQHVITDVIADFPDNHVLAIGDLSAEHGGQITEHRSHQSGRDADIGLYYKHKPDNYPKDFVRATEDNLDCAATYALVDRFWATRNQDGGAQMMFLDYEVQGILYHWALDNGVDESKLDKQFQFAHGRGGEGFVRHEPNHDNHLHVRFKCPADDSYCK